MNKDIRLLVVEDDGDINSLLCELLRRQGYHVRGAFSGTEAKMCLEYETYHRVEAHLRRYMLFSQAEVETKLLNRAFYEPS